MKDIRKFIIILTSWFSLIASIWLWLFRLVQWQGPLIFVILLIVVMMLEMAYTGYKK